MSLPDYRHQLLSLPGVGPAVREESSKARMRTLLRREEYQDGLMAQATEEANRATKAHNKGNFSEALERNTAAIKLVREFNEETGAEDKDAGNSLNLFSRALVFEDMGRGPEALADYKRALETSGLAQPKGYPAATLLPSLVAFAKHRIEALQPDNTASGGFSIKPPAPSP